MSATIIDLAPATLLRDEDGRVYAFRHLIYAASDRGAVPIERAAGEIMRQVIAEELTVVTPETKPSIPTCSQCGCTEEFACIDGCAWANAEKTLCTSCVRC